MWIFSLVGFAAFILAWTTPHALAFVDPNFASAAFASLSDWQRGIVHEIIRILILVRGGT